MIDISKRFYIDIWLAPVIIIYTVKLINSDFYSSGPTILALLISIILVLGSASIIPSFATDYIKESISYNSAMQNKSELTSNNKIMKIQMYSHIFIILLLSATYWVHITNAEKFITH